MAFALRIVTLLTALLIISTASYATDTSGICSSVCSFTIQIGQARDYIISVSFKGTVSGDTPVVTGKGVTKSYFTLTAAHYTIHAKYIDNSGTAKDPATFQCGTQVKYFYIKHNGNCSTYNDASVLVTLSN